MILESFFFLKLEFFVVFVGSEIFKVLDNGDRDEWVL